MEQPPAPPASGPTVPKLSTTVLLAMGAIATIVLVAIFAYILLVARLRLDEQLWWTGLTSMIFALGFYMMFAATHDRMIERLREAAVPDPPLGPRDDRPRGDLRHGEGRGERRGAARPAQVHPVGNRRWGSRGPTRPPGSHELVDVLREPALLDFFFHLLEDEDPLVGRRMGPEELVGAAPVALSLLFDGLLQFVRVDLTIVVQVVFVHPLLEVLIVFRGLDRVADHERPEARRLRVGPCERQAIRDFRQRGREQMRISRRRSA